MIRWPWRGGRARRPLVLVGLGSITAMAVAAGLAMRHGQDRIRDPAGPARTVATAPRPTTAGGVQEAEPVGDARPKPAGGRPQVEPPGTDPSAVEPYVEHLLRSFDHTVGRISANPSVAADTDHPLYDRLRALMTADSRYADVAIATLADQGERRLAQYGFMESTAPIIRTIIGEGHTVSTTQVSFPMCATPDYRLGRVSGEQIEYSSGPSHGARLVVRRIDGRWRIASIDATRSRDCWEPDGPKPWWPVSTGPTQPSSTDLDAVAPHIDRLLAKVDRTAGAIVADAAISGDPDHPRYRELLSVMAGSGDSAEGTPLEEWAILRRGQIGIEERPDGGPLPVQRRRVGDLEVWESREDIVTFPMCSYTSYRLYDRLGRMFGSSKAVVKRYASARRINGRWYLDGLVARFDGPECPPAPQ